MSGILDLFIPRERKFFAMLDSLSEQTLSGANLFAAFVAGYGRLTTARRLAIVEKLKMVERDCDKVTHDIAVELNKTFLTPIDREDIHRLSTLLDDIMDIVYNIGHKLVLYNIRRLPKYVLELTQTAVSSVVEVNILISKLGNKGKVSPHIIRIHELENDSDSLRNQAFAYLFNDSLASVEIIKMKDLYEWLEAVCDKAEDIADVVEGIVIKYA